ncbi:hypothetical protein AB3S75_047165 [Citrus x aurantiifolia]
MEVNSLSKFAVRGQWDNNVQAYENNPMSREAKLTKSGGTALHIAAAAGQTNIVSDLVENTGENTSNVLKIQMLFFWLQLLGMKQCATARPQKMATSSLFATMTVRLHSFWQPFMAIWLHFFASILLAKQKITVHAEKIMGRPFFILPYLENTLV